MIKKGMTINGFLLTLLCMHIISVVVLSSVPPVSRDALTHHLAVPRIYLSRGGIHEIPWIKFSYYPMNLDLIYMIPLYFGNDIAPKYIHFSFALFTGLLIFFHIKKKINNGYALFGVLFFLTIPVIIKLSITAYVDLGLVFFSTASLIYLIKWAEEKFRISYLLVSALSCGLALGTKYNSLIVFFLLSFFVPFVYSRLSRGAASKNLKAVGYCLFFSIVSLMVFSPWMARDYKWKGNPVYPLYDGFFNQGIHEKSKSANSHEDHSPEKVHLGIFGVRRAVYGESFSSTLLIPLRIFFQGVDDDPKYFDGKLNPFLLILPLLAFFPGVRKDRQIALEQKVFLNFSVLYILFAFMSRDMRIRYIAPVIPPLVILSVYGLSNLACIAKKIPLPWVQKNREVLSIILGISLLIPNANYIKNLFARVEPFGYISGRVSRDEYIKKRRPEYAAIQFANCKIPADSTILPLFAGNRRYYSERKMSFDFNLLGQAMKNTMTPDPIYKSFRHVGVTHLLVGYKLFNIWVKDNFDSSEKSLLLIFFKRHTALIYSKNGYGLYKLKQ